MSWKRRKKQMIPVLVIGLVIAASLMCSLLLPHGVAQNLLNETEKLRRLGAAGWIVFVAGVAFMALIGVVPGALLGLAAGAVYGVFGGFLAGAIGIGAAAVMAFGLSRSMLRPLITTAVGEKRIVMLDQVMAAGGWRLVALLRVSPVMPFSPTSYALGLSAIATRDYFVGSLAALPGLLGYVIIGALGGSTLAAKSRGGTAVHLGLLVLGAIATLGLTVYVTRLVSKTLRSAA